MAQDRQRIRVGLLADEGMPSRMANILVRELRRCCRTV